MKRRLRTVEIRPDEMILSESSYERLLRDQMLLEALMIWGVEDWDNYESALASIGGI